jgi:hypothetical protein
MRGEALAVRIAGTADRASSTTQQRGRAKDMIKRSDDLRLDARFDVTPPGSRNETLTTCSQPGMNDPRSVRRTSNLAETPVGRSIGPQSSARRKLF